MISNVSLLVVFALSLPIVTMILSLVMYMQELDFGCDEQ